MYFHNIIPVADLFHGLEVSKILCAPIHMQVRLEIYLSLTFTYELLKLGTFSTKDENVIVNY